MHRDDTLHADIVGVGLDARWYEGAAQRSKSLLYFAVSYCDSSPCSWSNLISESDQKKRFTEAYTVSKKLEIKMWKRFNLTEPYSTVLSDQEKKIYRSLHCIEEIGNRK